jgi:hypothetical protein
MATGRFINQITLDSNTYRAEFSVVADVAGPRVDKTGDNVLAVAKVGTLTTRTDDNTGELTMAASHGITTGARLDVYWSGGMRRGMTVGTVATNAVPIDGGAGDVLPANTTAITAQVPSEEAYAVEGDDLDFLMARTSRRGVVVFADGSDAELFAIVGELSGTTGGAYQWRDPALSPVASDGGVTNPVATDTVAKVFVSNGDSANTNIVQVACGYS